MARLFRFCLTLLGLLLATPLAAHPVPFSYLDLHIEKDRIDGTLTVHIYDFEHDLGIKPMNALLDHEVFERNQYRIANLIAPRMSLSTGKPLPFSVTGVHLDGAKQAVVLNLRAVTPKPGKLTVHTDLFPYDPKHQTFVNIYEGETLRQQWIFGQGGSKERTYYAGTTAGALAVIGTFVPSGIHHILIGPDHLLFLLGLLLLAGSWLQLIRIVTAFTIGHSITLTLAALNLVTPPATIIEPAIALTIIFVGADNLLRGEGKDLRAWAAFAFGLIHGFGFANVLREFGLPQGALGWSLFSFNVGVEIGQLCVVVPLALLLRYIWKRDRFIAKRIAMAGSVVVIAAGGYWFVQRVFFPGGM
jgi:hypothetical protein